MASVTYANKPGVPVKGVKNLGWLLRHKHEVEEFHVRSVSQNFESFRLSAFMSDGSIYRTMFANESVLRGWLKNRKAWRDVPCYWHCDKEVPVKDL